MTKLELEVSATGPGLWQGLPGGAVPLQADVAHRAIISTPCLLADAPYLARVEQQYVVDRRKLAHVCELARFDQAGWIPPWSMIVLQI